MRQARLTPIISCPAQRPGPLNCQVEEVGSVLPGCGKAAGLAEKCRVLRSMTIQILSLAWNVSSVEGMGKLLLPAEMVSPSPDP